MKLKELIKNKKFLIGAGIIFLVICIITIGVLVSTRKETVSDTEVTEIITPTQSVAKRKKKQLTEEKVSPTKKVISVTKAPTITTTVTPTKAVATNTPAPTTSQSTPTTLPTPTNTPVPTQPPDTQPPQTNVSYPTNSGEITYKTDGKVCAIFSAPTDNQSTHSEISTAYKFDSDGWSSFETGRASVCKDPLPNGAHTLSVKSKDKAGNEETEKIISFMVNIPGN